MNPKKKEWGSGGRKFKSSRPDQKNNKRAGWQIADLLFFYDLGAFWVLATK